MAFFGAEHECKKGDSWKVPQAIQKRFYSTVGIEYMEGSNWSLKPRETKMSLTVDSVTAERIEMSLDGYGHMGKEFDEERVRKKQSRGCEVRLIGKLVYNLTSNSFQEFKIVGIGEAWGLCSHNTRHVIDLGGNRWLYGVACRIIPTGFT